MLGAKLAVATLPVRDLATTRRFYEDLVGLEVAFEHEGSAIAYKAGPSIVLVYVSANAGTNHATAVTWVVGDDMPRLVEALKAKGVAFEHYEIPGTTLDGDIHRTGDLELAWFRDPDGNIHGLTSG